MNGISTCEKRGLSPIFRSRFFDFSADDGYNCAVIIGNTRRMI